MRSKMGGLDLDISTAHAYTTLRRGLASSYRAGGIAHFPVSVQYDLRTSRKIARLIGRDAEEAEQ